MKPTKRWLEYIVVWVVLGLNVSLIVTAMLPRAGFILGDPYYHTEALAWERAPWLWGWCLLGSGLAIVRLLWLKRK